MNTNKLCTNLLCSHLLHTTFKMTQILKRFFQGLLIFLHLPYLALFLLKTSFFFFFLKSLSIYVLPLEKYRGNFVSGYWPIASQLMNRQITPHLLCWRIKLLRVIMEKGVLKFPCGLSGGLGKSSVIFKDAYKTTINHVMRNGIGKRTKQKDVLCQCSGKATNTNCLKKFQKRTE